MIALLTSMLIFALGAYGAISKHDVMRIFISVSLMLSAITLLLVSLATEPAMAYSLVVFVWVVEVVEVIVTVALFLYLVRHGAKDVEVLTEFKW